LSTLVDSINPDALFCSGWIDKDYLKICKSYYKKVPTVLCMDTKWKGDPKQRLASILSPFLIKNKFSSAWVPGNVQKEFALKLGIKESNVFQGYYCADTNYFNNCYNQYKVEKTNNYPKKLLYVGRYYDFKGITDLWTAFAELQNENANEWELWCLGVGDIKPIEHSKIMHFGFIQPQDLKEYIKQCGAFVLPSRFEPWGVVVHEYAAAGLPLLLSSEVGSKETFLEEDHNGYEFLASNIQDLKEKLKKLFNLSNESLNLMSERSNYLSQRLTVEKWCATAHEIIK
jgi:glycosyltransferase involved in cell wall biosynthesis